MSKAQLDAQDANGGKADIGVVGMSLLCLVALASSFGGAYFFGGLTGAQQQAVVSGTDTVSEQWNHALVDDDMAFVSMGELTISIGGGPTSRFVKIDLSIITLPEDVRTVENAKAVLLDTFSDYLRSVSPEDFENPAFYPQMKQQLARRAEIVLGSAGSNGILITEFLLR